MENLDICQYDIDCSRHFWPTLDVGRALPLTEAVVSRV